MKKAVIGLAVLAVVVLVLARVGGSTPVPTIFTTQTLEEATRSAQAAGKLVLVDATASWCPPCRQMDRETWTDPRVEEWINAGAIAVRMDTDENGAWAQRNGISGIPTVIVYRDGEELGRRVGYAGPSELLAWVSGLASVTTPAR